jgi:hypothetical protein
VGTFTPASDNVAVTAVAAVSGFLSLHSANPGTTGANELAGGSPAYAREAASWSAAVNGAGNSVITLLADVTFDVPAGATVAFVGMFSAGSGGVFRGSDDVTPELYGGQGTYVVQAGSTLAYA